MYLKVALFFIGLALISTACQQRPNSTVDTAAPSPLPGETSERLDPIILPISIYILDDTTGELSSTRTAAQLEGIYEKVNEIWGQAGIVIEVQSISRIEVTPAHLEAITYRDFERFFEAIRNGEIDASNPSPINAFYARELGGPNGIAPFGYRVFFVKDTPSVPDERVTSHEIGHILNLQHVIYNTDHLMASGTNGVFLSEADILVARYAAQGLLDGFR